MSEEYRRQIRSQMWDLLVQQFALGKMEWDPDRSLSDLDLDSLDMLEYVIRLEQAFSLDLDERQLDSCLTFGEAEEAILAQIEGAARANRE